MKREEREFAQRIRQVLDADLADMDAPTRARLAAARRRALDAPASTALRPALGWALVGGIVIAAWLWGPVPGPTEPGPDEFSLLVNGEPMLLEQDIEFYQWLATQPAESGQHG